MEHESMRERKGVGTILRAGAAMALVAALAACGGGDGDAGANQETQMSDTPSLADRIADANAAAGGLTNESDAAAVAAARERITAAQEAIDALPGTEQDAENAKLAGSISLVEGQEARVELEGEVSDAIATAIAAAGALTDTSSEADVTRAGGLITDAQAEIDRLPADQQVERDAELADAIESVSKQNMRVADANKIAMAIQAANEEAAKLTDSSVAADVAAARAKIADAEILNADAALLATAEASVSHHENRLDKATATAAIEKAEAAVNGINNDSDHNAVTDAENEIKAAENEVAGLPNLSDGDKALLNGRIASAQSNLDTRKSVRVTAMAAKAAEEAKTRTADAKKLYEQLTGAESGITAAVEPAAERPSAVGTDPGNLKTAYDKAVKADNGIGTEEKAHVLVMNTKGAQIDVTSPPAGVPDGSTALTESTGDNIAKYVRGSGFATGTERKTHKNTDEIVGTYAGAAGKYTCVGNCASQVHSEGIQLTGTWDWDPNLNEPKYKDDDPHYAQFGVWLDDGLTSGAKVGAWYGFGVNGAAATDNNTGATPVEVTAASGTATYTGDAVGQAAFYDGTTSAENLGGAFTATATLNADFDDNNLSGTINNFDIGGVKPNWSVELMENDIADGGVAADQNPDTKWTVDGTAGAAGGDWSARFYDKPNNQRTPVGVAGGFLATHGDEGSMVGAFGAER